MGAVGRDPRWREAQRFAERHARLVLARVDVHASVAGDDVDLVGLDFAGLVDRSRSPVDTRQLEHLRIVAGARTAVFYSHSGFAKTAVLWADRHAVALFAYTDEGFATPVNVAARDLVHAGQETSEREVLLGISRVSRHATEVRALMERREREAAAAALREGERSREAEHRRRMQRDRREAVLGRTVALLVRLQVDPDAMAGTVERLATSSVADAVADAAQRLTLFERPAALELVRAEFYDGAAALEVVTSPADREGSSYRAARRAVDNGLDALDDAAGEHVTGHVAPDVVASELRRAARCWQVLVDEVARAAPLPATPEPGVPQQRGPQVPQPRVRRPQHRAEAAPS
ncbi:hypothetical protein [Cellulomonas sp. HZM]|uniref:hypothetical protein n=1 Tax=Cellulomonas sp. HZM TaxID=1454010 RepID=UPI000492F791|nr:hypothetical protein [Cellulomonas sp. HZM]